MSRARRGALLGGVGGAGLLAATIACWPTRWSAKAPDAASEALTHAAPPSAAAPPAPSSAPSSAPTSAPARASAPPTANGSQTGPGPGDDETATPIHGAPPTGSPHPLTAERAALQHELRLVGALQDALDLSDAAELRRLVSLYRAHVPSDDNALAEGYARLADCLEAGGRDKNVRTAAAAYYARERASTLRRYIRRVCLDP